jgi:outer membrane immunogenic protein
MIRMTSAGLLAAGSALALTATPALAQDEQRNDYTGFYIGISGGGAVQNNDRHDTVQFDVPANGSFGDTVTTTTGANAFSPGFCNGAARSALVASGCNADRDNAEYAAKVGYDRQIGAHTVAGLVLEGSKTNARDYTTAFSTTPASYTFSRSLDYAVSARARLGYTPNGSGLFYVTGGGSYGKLKHRFRTTNTANTFTQRGGDNDWGYQVGGGAEFALTSGVGVGLEYLYNRYRDNDYFVAVGQGTAPATNPFIRQGGAGTNMRPSDRDFDFHSLRVNLFYKF